MGRAAPGPAGARRNRGDPHPWHVGHADGGFLAHRADLAAKGDDPDTLHLRYIRQINAAIADRPADMRITTHM
ncbi:MAG: hypothetical protein L0H83_12390, partial [Salinisphaera sp.]|nr:hypothetical protein [Salinisphaera sp.]